MVVRVKTPSGFVTVPSGTDVTGAGRGRLGRGRRGRTAPISRRKAQQQQIDRVLADMRAGRLSQRDAASRVKTIQRGGGTGAAADPQKFKKAQEALQKFEIQKKAQAEAKIRITREEARTKAKREAELRLTQKRRERLRISDILRAKSKLIQRGATRNLREENRNRILASVLNRINKSDVAGRGTFTKAVDIGGGRMQDHVFRFSDGKITNISAIGESFPQSRRFKEVAAINGKVTREEKVRGRLLPLSIIPLPSIKQAKAGAFRAIDFISGGLLTERNLNKRGEQINENIEKFNRNFGDRELSEEEAMRANSISASIEREEGLLNKDRDKLAKSLKSKISGFLSPLEKRKTAEQTKQLIKRSQPRINRKEKELERVNINLKKSEGKTGTIAKINRRRLKFVKSGIEHEIGLLKSGSPPIVAAGEFPIIPAVGIPSGITTIKFLGTQKKGKGGKIITDIVFKTSKGRTGVARGVSVTKGKRTASVVLGRSGKVAFKFPSAKRKLTSVKSFIGREISITKPTKFVRKTELVLKARVGTLKRLKRIGTVTKVKKNIQAFKQAGIGQVASVKGKKFIKPFIKFPSGKLGTAKARGISLDDFASISAIFTKKELSLIVGRSITEAGAKAKFIGLIKGTSKAGKTFTIAAADKQQFAAALKNVISAASAGLTKSNKIGGLTKSASLITASRIAVATAKGKPTPRPKLKPITRGKAKAITRPPITKPKPPKPKAITKPRARTTGRAIAKAKPKAVTKPKPVTKPKVTVKPITKPKEIQKARQRLRQLQKQKQRLAQKLSQKLTQKQIQRQRQRLRQVQRQINKITPRLRGPFVPGVPRVPRIPFIPKIKRKKKRKKKPKRKQKKKQAYNVFARPIKKTKKAKRPKLVKVNKVPLRKKRARDLRNFITDTSLSRTGRIKKGKGKPRKPKLRVPKGYAKKTSIKFRRHRIVKGKRKLLPKGKVIERRKRLLDTVQERRKITLRRRIKQITPKRKPSKRIVKKRKRLPMKTRGIKRRQPPIRSIRQPVRRSSGRKRVRITGARRQQMLRNLEKGRKVRMRNLRRKPKTKRRPITRRRARSR